MGRKSKITQFESCKVHTDHDNPLCRILYHKNKERAKPIISRFEAYTGLPFDGSSLSVFNLTLFKDRCYIDFVSPNSVATTCAWLASVIRVYCNDNGINPDAMCKALLAKRVQSNFGFVTESDIEVLIGYYRTCTDSVDRAVSAFAILEFYTAARKSDTADFSIDNIHESKYIDKNTGEHRSITVLTYTSHKTDIRASIPTKPIVREILQDPAIRDVNVTTRMFDDRIKHIFKDAGITHFITQHRAGRAEETIPVNECVSSHMFRRSFATNLDRKGVSIETISRMMGHTNTEQTRRYVCDKTLVLDEEAISFFR